MCPGLAPHVHPPQAVVVQQVAKHGLHGALPQPALTVPAPALLPLPRPVVGCVVNRFGELFALRSGHANGLKRALLAVAVRGPVLLRPAAVGRDAVPVKGQDLARGAGVGIGGPVVREADYFGFVLAKDGDSCRDLLGFEQGIVRAVRVAGIGKQVT
jgi:hypothetical protein